MFVDGHPDLRLLITDAVSYLLGDAVSARTNAPESVIMTRLESESVRGRLWCTFVNMTSVPYRPLRSIVPVRDIRASVTLPDNTAATMYRHRVFDASGEVDTGAVAEDRPVTVTCSKGVAQIDIPELHDFPGIRFERD